MLSIEEIKKVPLDEPYCYKCGAKMILSDIKVKEFSARTGEPEYGAKVNCPYWSKWNIFNTHANRVGYLGNRGGQWLWFSYVPGG